MKLPINVDMTPQLLHRVKLAATAGASVILAMGTVFGTHAPSGFPETMNGCSIYGSSETDSDAGAANALKNRYTVPGQEDIDEDANLHSLLSIRVKGEDAEKDMADKFDSSKGGRIRGYVVEVALGVANSSNCKASDPRYRDTYLYIAKSPNADVSKRVLVSVTPRIRALKSKEGIDWSTEALKKYRGRYVEVSGWLFFDDDHWGTSKDNPEHEWEIDRATCWSLYPATDLQEVDPKVAVSEHKSAKTTHGEQAHTKSKPEHSAAAVHVKPTQPKAAKPHTANPKAVAKPKPAVHAPAKPHPQLKTPIKPKFKAPARKVHRAKPRIRFKAPRRKVVKRAPAKTPRRGIVVYR